MKKNIIIGITGVVIVVVLFLIFGKSSKDDYKLETTSMLSKDINIIVTATGRVEPVTKVDVGTQVSGIISRIYVDYNSKVTTGQVLAELDKIALQSDLRSKEMELNAARVEYEYQKKNVERISELYKKELVSQTDYETASYTYEKAQSTFNKLTSDLVKVRTNLGYATIYSPIDGIVLSRAVEEGQTVAASFNTPTLFVIAKDLTKMQVVANVDEADIGSVHVGQRVSFTVDAYPIDIFQGTVSQVRLEPIITSNVVTYEVLVNAPNPDMKLKPGLTANITIFAMEKKDIHVLSNKVFAYSPDIEILKKKGYSVPEEEAPPGKLPSYQKRVWTLTGNTIQPKIVMTGVTDGVNTEIVSGLNESDVVIEKLTAIADKNAKPAEKSPFMPQRGGGGGRMR